MTITSGDIKLVKTQVMADVPEGGGAPTSTVVPDGQSNAIFPDISDDNRAAGVVNLRKLGVHVDTNNVDDFLGANVIVARPPNDPNVAITLFSTGETFDRRASAVSRIEAYLSIGPAYQGYLFGNHITGQSTLLVYQKTAELPPIGDTLVLTKREGYSDQFRQYVRVTAASAQPQTFSDVNGTYDRYILELELSSPLTADFPGFDISRFDYSKLDLALATRLSETIVADAARYYGVTPFKEPGSIGDFTIYGESMFTQLVPSAQAEVPILDARTNQMSTAVVQGGAPVQINYSFTRFAPGFPIFVGGAIAPGTLTLRANTNPAWVSTDVGGRLMQLGVEIGQVDYENGILSASVDNPWTTGTVDSVRVEYVPGGSVQAPTQSQGFEITVENRSLNYVRTMVPPPVKERCR